MGDRRITDLTAQASFASGDCLAVDNSGNTETKKITAADAITTPINNVSKKVSGSTDAYSSSKAYSVGDLVIYNNTVYECTTACSAASWSVNQSNFTATTLSSKLTSLNQALTTLNSNIANKGKWTQLLGNTSTTGQKTLSDSVANYSTIALIVINGSNALVCREYPKTLFVAGYSLKLNEAGYFVDVSYVSNTSVNITALSSDMVRIYGIQ